MGTILFSAIGTSDPIREYHDGGWLHCLRKIHPERTYIYLSRQMLEYEASDHRYTRTIELFNQEMVPKGFPPVILEKCEMKDLRDPHLYGTQYEDIKSLLTMIHQKYPKDTIYINCSSGTPVIKNCLADMRTLLPFGKNLKLMQVDDPEKGVRKNDERIREEYDPETSWDLNLDRKEPVEWRVHPLAPDQHDMMIRAAYAKKLIGSHSYFEARILIEQDMHKLKNGSKVIAALEGADFRSMLLLPEASEKLKKAGIGCDNLQNESNMNLRKCAEMLLTMQNDLAAKHFADVLRKMTPLLYALCTEYIFQQWNWNPESYVTRSSNGKVTVNWTKLAEEHPDFTDLFTKNNKELSGFLASWQLIRYISRKEKRAGTPTGQFYALRYVEEDVRNIAAHEIVGIQDSWVRNNTRNKLSVKEILDRFKQLFLLMTPVYKKDFWNSYSRMNEEICRLIDGLNYTPQA